MDRKKLWGFARKNRPWEVPLTHYPVLVLRACMSVCINPKFFVPWLHALVRSMQMSEISDVALMLLGGADISVNKPPAGGGTTRLCLGMMAQ